MSFYPINWLSFMAFQILFCYLSPFPTITISLSTSPTDLSTWETVFQGRSDEEWRTLWHSERHRRCYQELESHMRWVCNKDIYKVKKSENEAEPHREPRGLYGGHHYDSFISQERALNLLGSSASSVRRKRGIIDECCHGATGCSWEEYAEYCTHNNRMRV